MRIPRIYVRNLDTTNTVVTLEGQAARHLLQVLRVRPGQAVIMFDGGGNEYRAEVMEAHRDTATLRVISQDTVNRESNLSITLVQAISRGDRMDWLLQKATELGVARVIPVFSKRSIIKLDDKRLDKKIHHWQGIISHACEQCGRNQLPEISPPIELSRVMSELPEQVESYYLEPECGTRMSELDRAEAVNLFIGPEGGFDAREKDFMRSHGVHPVSMGPRVLRTETAGIAAIAALGILWGDL